MRATRAADGVWWMRTLMANVCFVGSRERWVLVDAGIRGYAGEIARAAGDLFGYGRRPEAIVLTHAHFDHVGSLRTLAERWGVQVYAHALEQPYITGRSSYPPPDPLVGGGAMAWMATLYPRGPIDTGPRAGTLPADGTVPGLEQWRWIHTPGHTPGHVSLFRDRDRVLIAGDAVVTTKQESLISVMTQREEVHGPPAYYTPDWETAGRSVRSLAALEPSVLVTGHGHPLSGPRMRSALGWLADRFEVEAVPARGRYVPEPARADERGVAWLPPDPLPGLIVRSAAPVALGAAALVAARRLIRARRRLSY